MKLSPSDRTIARNEGSSLTAAHQRVERAARRTPGARRRSYRTVRRWLWLSLVLLAATLSWWEVAAQRREDQALGVLARRIVTEANARNHREIALALQHYLQAHIEFRSAPYHHRPFFRATAVETLQSGKGYCGEVTRAFVKLAGTLGVRAQRVNLYGKALHVVGEVELENGERLIVDSQQPPSIPELEPIEQVLLLPQFDEYSTLNVRRLKISQWFTGINLRFGTLALLWESPHALKALLWGTLAGILLLGMAVTGLLHWSVERAVRRRLAQGAHQRSRLLEPLSGGEEVLMEGKEAEFATHMEAQWISQLLCPVCQRALQWEEARSALRCATCGEIYPIEAGIPRLLPATLRAAIGSHSTATRRSGSAAMASDAPANAKKIATARSFGFEWQRFPEMHGEWEDGFWNYMAPYGAEVFRGQRVLDAGCGNGRHAFYAARSGAEVWAVDLGEAVEVAQQNNANNPRVHIVQADLCQLPFAPESFDLVYSIGVLHHLSEPEAAFRNLLRYVKPGGRIHIYLYWKPEGQPIKRALLALVNGLRHVTTHLPHRLLYGLAYPAAAFAFAGFVLPYQMLSATGLNGLAERLPMKQYARYPFRVCVNDQFDRFSAPIENRYTREEVEGWLTRAGLQEIEVRANFGWCATGRKR